jgi:hypothetical protein
MLLTLRPTLVLFVSIAAVLFASCATRQPTGASAPQATPPATRTVIDSKPETRFELPAEHIDGGRGVVRLCELLRQSDGLTFKGNAVEKARQRQVQEQQRTLASETRYEVSVPSEGFTFEGYDLGDGRLRLADRRFAIEDGIELDRPSSDEAIGFVLSEAAAERLLQMHAEGHLQLRLVFTPQGSQMRPDMCIRQSAGRIIKLGALVLAAYVVGPTGTLLAKHESESFAQEMATLTPVQTPIVSVGKAITSDTTPIVPAVQSALSNLVTSLLSCYRDALIRRSTEQGTLIVGVILGKDGQIQQARMEMSTVKDESMVDCAVAVIGKVVLPTTSKLPAGFSLPISFSDAKI